MAVKGVFGKAREILLLVVVLVLVLGFSGFRDHDSEDEDENDRSPTFSKNALGWSRLFTGDQVRTPQVTLVGNGWC